MRVVRFKSITSFRRKDIEDDRNKAHGQKNADRGYPLLAAPGQHEFFRATQKRLETPGGFSGKSAGILPVTVNGAAVIPSQWGGKAVLRPFLSQIGGIFPNVNYSFQGVVDVVGSNRIPNVQALLMSKNPGDLILELPGAPKDFGVTPVTLTIPGALPCPAGTSQVQQ